MTLDSSKFGPTSPCQPDEHFVDTVFKVFRIAGELIIGFVVALVSIILFFLLA